MTHPTRIPLEVDVETLLDRAHHGAFGYFQAAVDPASGLVLDSTQEDSPCSITAVGMALAAYPIAVERGTMPRAEAIELTLATLRFFRTADMSGKANSTGYRGFYFHFLDMSTGTRAWRSELSSVDTSFLVAGFRMAALYFTRDTVREREIRATAQFLDERVDWRWMQHGDGAICHGWHPETGFLRYRWVGYAEALLMYAFALGSPWRPVTRHAWHAWAAGYQWKRIYGHEHLFAGPLFIHQYSHMWIDFKGIQDAYMRDRGIDYFENSRRATLVQREYAIRNPKHFRAYCAKCWGWSACDGPGPRDVRVDGRQRHLLGYAARGAPYGPDDGTVAPYASVASLPFAPEVVLPTMEHIVRMHDERPGYVPGSSFNPTLHGHGKSLGWVSPYRFALNSGPVVLMVENFRSGLPWTLMKQSASLRLGLHRAGFRGGWLDARDTAK
ncbi:MAG TPA: glucoamylase family protein [Burkholderiaceae bacterium]|nr:glucoamylase family protein [Burkholderiaceae bacterium]